MTAPLLRRPPLGLVLALALSPSLLPGQAPPSCTDPALQLQVGHVEVQGGVELTVWDCTTPDALLGALRITGAEGTWAFLLTRLEVHTDDPAKQGRLATFLGAHPWLAPYAAPATELHSSLGGPPDLRIEAGVVDGYLRNCMIPAFGQYPLPSEQVRLWCQPILDLDAGSTVESATWTATAPDQEDWLLGENWGKALADPSGSDLQTFGWWPLMQSTALFQAPTPGDALHLLDDEAQLKEAIDLGLTIHVQAFGLRDADPALDPGIDPNQTPGLPSLDHLPPVEPDLFVSTAIPIPILPALPFSGPPPQRTDGPYDRPPGSPMQISLSWFVPTTLVHFPGPGGIQVAVPASFHSPGVVTVLVPTDALSGPLHFTSPYGTTIGVVNDPPLYVNPLGGGSPGAGGGAATGGG